MTTTPETPKPPGRPKTATGRTPDKVRAAQSMANLRLAGGDKIAARLPASSLRQLKLIKAARGFSTTEAVIFALDIAAKVPKPRR